MVKLAVFKPTLLRRLFSGYAVIILIITSDVNTEIATTSVIEDQNVFGAGFEIKF